MRYFIAVFCSPLALLLALRPIAAILNAFLYVLAFVGLILGGWGVVFWALGVLHAWVVISNKKADQRADRVIRAQQQTR